MCLEIRIINFTPSKRFGLITFNPRALARGLGGTFMDKALKLKNHENNNHSGIYSVVPRLIFASRSQLVLDFVSFALQREVDIYICRG
jgi:hypothetical protein